MTMRKELSAIPRLPVRTLTKVATILALALPLTGVNGLDQVRAQELTPQSVTARSERVYTPLTISRQNKDVTFQVEVADNDNARALGLMFRTKMLENEGMIFDFGESRPVYMWMQNTYISSGYAVHQRAGAGAPYRGINNPSIALPDRVWWVCALCAGSQSRNGETASVEKR